MNEYRVTNVEYRIYSPGTRHTKSRFVFDFVFIGHNWRIYIREHPPYRGRPGDAATIHVLSDSGGRYICWTGEVRSLDEAKGVAAAWAHSTDTYIDTGSFPPPAARTVEDFSRSEAYKSKLVRDSEGTLVEVAADGTARPRRPAPGAPARPGAAPRSPAPAAPGPGGTPPGGFMAALRTILGRH